MNTLLKNILFSLLAAIMLGLTGGISITKMQCSKGSKLFVGVENRTCHIQESNTCTKAEAMSSCCKAKTKTPIENLPCNKETIELVYDYDTVVSNGFKVDRTLNFIPSKKLTSLQTTKYSPLTLTFIKDKSPPLVSKPILSKIQSFLI
jgi:hypothetical protein